MLALVLARSANRESGAVTTSPLEFAAALIAVITLRQVLVPPDVAGFTILDKILGIQAATITAIVIVVQTFPRPAAPKPD